MVRDEEEIKGTTYLYLTTHPNSHLLPALIPVIN